MLSHPFSPPTPKRVESFDSTTPRRKSTVEQHCRITVTKYIDPVTNSQMEPSPSSSMARSASPKPGRSGISFGGISPIPIRRVGKPPPNLDVDSGWESSSETVKWKVTKEDSIALSPVSPSRSYQDRLILPLGTKEIEFMVPQTLSPLTPTFGRKGLNSGESSPGSLSGSRSETEPSTSRANTPSPIFFRGSGSDIPGACSLFHGLNPELYKSKPGSEEEDDGDFPENHVGRVSYSLEYDTSSERLLVGFIKARNLPKRHRDDPEGSLNPFVRVSLFPDERRTLQSKPRANTRQPYFDETFGFQVSKGALSERSLKLCFYDVDPNKKHTMLGYIIQPLKDIDWSFGKQMFKEDLVREIGELSPNIGEVLVSLCYKGATSRLIVTIFEAKGIKSRESASGLYAKISLTQHTKVVKTKKTASVPLLGCRSSFNESFNFKLPEEMLDTASISIQLMYAQPGYNKDQLAGRIVLGSFMFARGKGLEHWTEMLTKQKEQITLWHAVSE